MQNSNKMQPVCSRVRPGKVFWLTAKPLFPDCVCCSECLFDLPTNSLSAFATCRGPLWTPASYNCVIYSWQKEKKMEGGWGGGPSQSCNVWNIPHICCSVNFALQQYEPCWWPLMSNTRFIVHLGPLSTWFCLVGVGKYHCCFCTVTQAEV